MQTDKDLTCPKFKSLSDALTYIYELRKQGKGGECFIVKLTDSCYQVQEGFREQYLTISSQVVSFLKWKPGDNKN